MASLNATLKHLQEDYNSLGVGQVAQKGVMIVSAA
jgi:hypothetical protein